MAKDYKRGIDFRLYLGSGTWGSESWDHIAAAQDIDVADNPDDIAIAVRGLEMGHLRGLGDPSITFTLAYDKGDTNVLTMVAAMGSGAMTTIAVADGDIVTAGTTYWKMQAVLMGKQINAPTSGPATFEVSAFRHVNSDNALTEVTVLP